MSGSELLYIWHIYFTRPDDTNNNMTFFHIGLKCAYKTLTTSYATNFMCYQLYYRLRSYQFTQTKPKCMQQFPLNVLHSKSSNTKLRQKHVIAISFYRDETSNTEPMP